MAFSSHSAANYEVQAPLRIDYAGGKYKITDKYGATISDKWYKYERRARKTFSYKGMTEAACKACVDAMNARYTRKLMGWTQSGFGFYTSKEMAERNAASRATPDYFQSVAEIGVTRRTVVFDVQVTVDETVVIYLTSAYDVNTALGRAALETEFQKVKYSYLSTYGYDEPGGGS